MTDVDERSTVIRPVMTEHEKQLTKQWQGTVEPFFTPAEPQSSDSAEGPATLETSLEAQVPEASSE